MDKYVLGWGLTALGLVFGLFAVYCIYRLWTYGPYNTNLIFQMIEPRVSFGSVGLVSLGISLIWADWIVFLIAFIVYFFTLRIVQHICIYFCRRSQQSERQGH